MPTVSKNKIKIKVNVYYAYLIRVITHNGMNK